MSFSLSHASVCSELNLIWKYLYSRSGKRRAAKINYRPSTVAVNSKFIFVDEIYKVEFVHLGFDLKFRQVCFWLLHWHLHFVIARQTMQHLETEFIENCLHLLLIPLSSRLTFVLLVSNRAQDFHVLLEFKNRCNVLYFPSNHHDSIMKF